IFTEFVELTTLVSTIHGISNIRSALSSLLQILRYIVFFVSLNRYFYFWLARQDYYLGAFIQLTHIIYDGQSVSIVLVVPIQLNINDGNMEGFVGEHFDSVFHVVGRINGVAGRTDDLQIITQQIFIVLNNKDTLFILHVTTSVLNSISGSTRPYP